MVLALAAALAMADWQDKLLNVPYGGDSPQQVGLQLLRQDFEDLERNLSVIKTPLIVGSKHFAHGLGTHSFSHIRVKSAEPIVARKVSCACLSVASADASVGLSASACRISWSRAVD